MHSVTGRLRLPHLRLGRAFSNSAVHRGTDNSNYLRFHGQGYSWLWLRDACQCPSCLHPSTRQKLLRTSDVPKDVKPAPDGVQVSYEGADVKWDSGHRSFYPREFLMRYGTEKSLRTFHRDPDRVEWDVETLRAGPDLYLPYDAIKTPEGLLRGLTQLTRYGLLFVRGVPTEKTSNEECELRALGERFGELRKTFYGETWDVKNVRNSRNIAYTNVDLGLHMDLLYFQHPPRYQILHCLRNRVHGGTSIFVDAIRAASQFRTAQPHSFDVLARTPVAFHYINDGHHLHHEHPTIQLTAQYYNKPSPNNQIAFVNYSPPFQAPLSRAASVRKFVPALKRFAYTLEDPAGRFEYLLKEGDAVLFDNRRVLHARTAFREREREAGSSDEETTNRWLKGCYLEADAILDRRRVLDAQLRGEVAEDGVDVES